MRRFLALFAAVLLAGCGGSSSAPTVAAPTPAAGGSSRVPPPPGGIELKDTTYAALDAAVKANTGKVVLVDVWATFCGPCLKKMPHLTALHEKHAKSGLALVLVTIDEKEKRAEALEILTKNKATGTNLILADTEAEAKKWAETYPVEQLPVLMLYNRKGERVLTDFGKLPEAELDKKVEKLLAEK